MCLFYLKMWCFSVVCLLMVNLKALGQQMISLDVPVCCFNGTSHRPGSIVYEINESCVNLICAVDKSKSPTAAAIVKVQKRTRECEGTPCKDCYDTSCVDDFGLVRLAGETWMQTKCVACECTVGQVVDCKPVPVACEPQPNPSCVEIPGPCCPLWNCSDQFCVDDDGKRREIDEEWGGPCVFYSCSPRGILISAINCVRPPLLNSSCELFTPKDECCPVVSCGCVDDQGFRRKINETWGSPCIKNTCTPKGIATLIIDCQDTSKVNASCQLVFKKDQCCPEISCGCVDGNGIVHSKGSTWERGCSSFMCTGEGKIIEAPVNCTNRTLGEPEHLNCIVSVVPGKCCPEWVCGINCALVRCGGPPRNDCVANAILPLQCCATYNCPANSTGCVDADGIKRAIGSKWEKGCTSSECVEEGNIIEVPVTCPSINDLGRPKHKNCIIGIPPKKCCPEWICGPDCALLLCAGPPSRTCVANDLPPLQCCPTYTCPQNLSGCIDAIGTFRVVGSKWERGCTSFQCVEEGNIIEAPIVCSSVDTFRSPSHSNCIVGIVPGKCCPEWICGPNCAAVLCLGPPNSACIANEIPLLECCATYECPRVTTSTTTERNIGKCKVGTTWIQDCLEHTCTAEGIVSNPYQCKINSRPAEGCTLVLPPGKCCLEWQCGKSAAEITDESELVIPIPL